MVGKQTLSSIVYWVLAGELDDGLEDEFVELVVVVVVEVDVDVEKREAS